jgi:hypothetical protein
MSHITNDVMTSENGARAFAVIAWPILGGSLPLVDFFQKQSIRNA